MCNVLWFCIKFHTLSSSAKKIEDRLRFDKVSESLKVGIFLRHSVLLHYAILFICFGAILVIQSMFKFSISVSAFALICC